MKTACKRAAQKRLEKLDDIREALETSEYSAVIAPFRDNENFRFVGHALIQLRRIENQVIADLMESDDAWDENDIDEAIVSHFLKWSETIDRMVRILEVARDQAWHEFDKIDGVISHAIC